MSTQRSSSVSKSVVKAMPAMKPDLIAVVQLQACIRGHQVRARFVWGLREEFQTVFDELSAQVESHCSNDSFALGLGDELVR